MMTDKTNFKYWGEIKRERLPKEIDIQKMKQPKPLLIDEPLLPSMLKIDHAKSENLSPPQTKPSDNKRNNTSSEQTKTSLRPSIDSYIINTIKLNQLLKNQVAFDQVDFFLKKPANKSNNSASKKLAKLRVNNDQDARYYMKQFITIMSLHCGFVGKNKTNRPYKKKTNKSCNKFKRGFKHCIGYSSRRA
jgi:hypothetical protein